MSSQSNETPVVSLSMHTFHKQLASLVKNNEIPEKLAIILQSLVNQLSLSVASATTLADDDSIGLAKEYLQGPIKFIDKLYKLVVFVPDDNLSVTEGRFFYLMRCWPYGEVKRLNEL